MMWSFFVTLLSILFTIGACTVRHYKLVPWVIIIAFMALFYHLGISFEYVFLLSSFLGFLIILLFQPIFGRTDKEDNKEENSGYIIDKPFQVIFRSLFMTAIALVLLRSLYYGIDWLSNYLGTWPLIGLLIGIMLSWISFRNAEEVTSKIFVVILIAGSIFAINMNFELSIITSFFISSFFTYLLINIFFQSHFCPKKYKEQQERLKEERERLAEYNRTHAGFGLSYSTNSTNSSSSSGSIWGNSNDSNPYDQLAKDRLEKLARIRSGLANNGDEGTWFW